MIADEDVTGPYSVQRPNQFLPIHVEETLDVVDGNDVVNEEVVEEETIRLFLVSSLGSLMPFTNFQL